jgi:hypothetical protein
MSDFRTRTGEGRGPGPADEARDGDAIHSAENGSPIPADRDRVVTHRLHIDPSRTMKAVTAEVESMLDGMDQGPRHSGALLASELIAQVVARTPEWNTHHVELTIQLRPDAVRLEAAGPAAPASAATRGLHVVPDPIADWGAFLIERLADRWGVDGGSHPSIWAEIETPVSATV